VSKSSTASLAIEASSIVSAKPRRSVPQCKAQLMPKKQTIGFKLGARLNQVDDDHSKSIKGSQTSRFIMRRFCPGNANLGQMEFSIGQDCGANRGLVGSMADIATPMTTPKRFMKAPAEKIGNRLKMIRLVLQYVAAASIEIKVGSKT
jgi:hypothetical protein